jgi:ureidoglycolate hydrolase
MIKRITPAAFKKYGRVIEYPASLPDRKGRNLFCIVVTEHGKVGWRIAYLVVRDRKVARLEQHPGTWESFEPVKGRSVLYLSTSRKASQIEAFLLDRPVVLKKRIWHAVACVGAESEIKITENARVECVYWDLGCELSPARVRRSKR